MTTLINLILGDWSGDGHCQSSYKTIESNLELNKLRQAYNNGTKILGFDFCEKIAKDYHDRVLKKKHYEILLKHGIILKLESYDFQNEDILLDSDLYTKIYLQICELGNSDFEYRIINLTEEAIGGYGLFD